MTDLGAINNVYRGDLNADAGHGVSPNWLFGYFKKIGANDNEAHLLTSAAASESRLNPNASHDNGVGYGFWGHNGQRLLAMKNFASRAGGTIADPQMQAQFALQELRSRPEGKAAANATTPEQLALAEMHYEQPQGFTSSNPEGGHNFTGRLNQIRYFTGLNPNATGAFAPSANPQVDPGQVAGAGISLGNQNSDSSGTGGFRNPMANVGDPALNAALTKILQQSMNQGQQQHRTPLLAQLLGHITQPIHDALSGGINSLFGGAAPSPASPNNPAPTAGSASPSQASNGLSVPPVSLVPPSSAPTNPQPDVPMPPPRPPELDAAISQMKPGGAMPPISYGTGGPAFTDPSVSGLFSLFGASAS